MRTIGYLLASDGKRIWGTGRTQPAAEKRAKAKLVTYEQTLKTQPSGEFFDGASLSDFARQLLATKKRIAERSVEKYTAYIGYLSAKELAINTPQGRAAVIGDVPVKSVGTFEFELFMETCRSATRQRPERSSGLG